MRDGGELFFEVYIELEGGLDILIYVVTIIIY